MLKPCDICLDEKCGGTHECNCITCKNKANCIKYLKPTIRITTKCTQNCSHCCFSCSPTSSDMVSIHVAKRIKNFLKSNNIHAINLMGGEFFCNPDWYEIVETLSKGLKAVRLVTNGDWANSVSLKTSLLSLLTNNKNIHMSISKDHWHTNQFVNEAQKFCEEYNFSYNIALEDQTTEDAIVPIGKALFTMSAFSLFNCYCHNPIHHYTFLIDEQGKIYKCSFGVWSYANVKDYEKGGFAERFKEFNKAFYNVFIPHCKSCLNSYERAKEKRKRK